MVFFTFMIKLGKYHHIYDDERIIALDD